MRERHDTVIIGGGQAGLAMSAVLRQTGREHVVLERRRVAERWRSERWDSLRFQFPNWSLQMPGYRYAGSDPEGFAHYIAILRLLEDYAVSTHRALREHTDVVDLRADDAGSGFLISLPNGSLHARRVVLATGPFQRPNIPALSQGISSSVVQTDPTRYRCPQQLPDGAVLVVASGASGCQIADELLRSGRRVYLSVSQHRVCPGVWAAKTSIGGWSRWPAQSDGRQLALGAVAAFSRGHRDQRRLRRQCAATCRRRARVVGRVTDAASTQLAVDGNANRILDEADQSFRQFLSAARDFAVTQSLDICEEPPEELTHLPAGVDEPGSLDLTRQNITAIVWATGYTYDFGWIRVPVLDPHGQPVQHRGATRAPGLYFLGLHWMHTLKSGLLSGVGSDAEHIAEHMDRPH